MRGMQPGSGARTETPSPTKEEPLFFERAVAVLFFLLIWFCALILIYGAVGLLWTGEFFANPIDHLMLLEGAVGFGAIAALLSYAVFRDWRKRRLR